MASNTVRVLPPPTAAGGTATAGANGRTYVCAVGSSLDVPLFDAAILNGNGWIIFPGQGPNVGSGATANRPTVNADGTSRPVTQGSLYFDTTLNQVVIADGAGSWRNYAGATV